MLRYLTLTLLILIPLTGRADDPPALTFAFTPAQRAEIVGILRDALRTDPSILRDAILALRQDETVRQETAARAAVASVGSAVASGADPAAGNSAGDVTVVEFYDLRCPYCRGMLPVTSALLQHDRGVRWVYKDIPVLGPASVLAARAALAAQRQGGYQKFHDAVMHGTPNITIDTLHADADRTGLDWARLRRDMDDPAIAARLDTNVDLARKLGIDGTPAYVVGGRMLAGAMDEAALEHAVVEARGR
ncbi:MAG TPA: DsbA family protein [Acetobacteraceae bacterium]|jgi:protein-disulfide isomerase|nr:DsbA family protein [Acetobacteraceae bacterium]